MKLLTPSTGWISHDNHLYWTTDSGSNWTDITPVPPGVVRAGVNMRSVYFLNTQEGWVVVSYPQRVVPLTLKALRARGTLYQIASTVDGGQTWSFLPLSYPALSPDEQAGLTGPGDMYFLDSLHGWLVMAFDGNSDPGRLLVTDDGGRNWIWQHGVGFSGIIRFTSLKDGWLLGGPYEQLFATHDGGATWQEVRLSAPPQAGTATDATFQGLPVFSNNEDGFAVVHYSGVGSTASKLVIYSTHDAGKAWKLAKVLPESRVYWHGVRFPFAITDSTLVVAARANNVGVGRVPLTGQVQSSVAASRRGTLGLSFADPEDGWALSVSGKLLATEDGGTTWKDISPWRVSTPASRSSLPPINHPRIQIEVTQPGTSQLLSPLTPSAGGSSNLHPSIHLGFDKSDVLPTGDMGRWWTYSPYYDVYIYLPGSPNRHTDSNLTSGWVTTIKSQGWGLVSIWFGLQPPCLINGDPSITQFIDPANAAQEGADGANAAANAAAALGLSKTIIYKDMENFYTDSTHAACDDAVKAYVSNWDSTLQALGYQAGVYANPLPIQLDIGYVSPAPDDIWITHFDDRATIFDPTAGWDSLWPPGQRGRQYVLNITETYDGQSYGIDRDIEDAPVAGASGSKIYTYPSANFYDLGGMEGFGINDAYQGEPPKVGQIAGYESGGLIYDNGSTTSVNGCSATYGCNPYGLNNAGQVDGSYGPGLGAEHGFLYDQPTMTYSTIDYPGTSSTLAQGINGDDQIVGWFLDGSGNEYGYLDNEGTFSSISGSPTYTRAEAINGVGQIVGNLIDSHGNYYGFVYENGTITDEIKCKGAAHTGFYGINNNQLIVGTCDPNGYNEGFVYDLANQKVLDTFSYAGGGTSTATYGWGVNDSGQISGYFCYVAGGCQAHGYYVTPSHQ